MQANEIKRSGDGKNSSMIQEDENHAIQGAKVVT